MDLALHRQPSSDHSTLGSLTVNGQFECVTLEDVARAPGVKVQDQTAIPAGRYRVIINLSPRLQKMMMRLVDVPMFTGILIHSGNDAEDTKGCILVGQQVVNTNYIHGGSNALPVLQRKVQAALDKGEEVWITITDAPHG